MADTIYLAIALLIIGGSWIGIGWYQSKLDITRIMREQDMTIRRMHDAPVIRCSPSCPGHIVLPHEEETCA